MIGRKATTFYAVLASARSGRTKHSVGTLADHEAGTMRPLPATRVMLAEPEGSKSAYLLIRYAEDGSFAGDTWHETLEDAKHQARFEFDEDVEWRPVPDDGVDPVAYALTALKAAR